MKNDAAEIRAAYIGVTTLFLAWGFITAMNDALIPAVRAIFSLTYTESMLTQFAFFMAYGVVSLPAAALVARRGYANGILIALAGMLAGCLLMLVATDVAKYAIVLVALFVIASGITVLQVAANPLAAALGPPERSHLRLTLSQAFNSCGTVIAPYLGSQLMLRGGVFASGGAGSADLREASLRSIDRSYLVIAFLIAVLIVFLGIKRRRLQGAAHQPAAAPSTLAQAFKSRWALLGGLAIFLYVGAEVSIASVMTNYLHQPSVLGVTIEYGAKLVSLYWLGAMVGRFAGSALMTRIPAVTLTLAAALTAAVLCGIVITAGGTAAAVAAISIGLFNSILFPTIFTLTLERSTAGPAATSGFLCMAIVGGAVLPLIVGRMADQVGLAASFTVPAVAYLLIAAFAYFASGVVSVSASAGGAQPSH